MSYRKVKFLGADHQLLFIIEDGDEVEMIRPDGSTATSPVRYLGAETFSIFSHVWDIDEFAEIMSTHGISYRPKDQPEAIEEITVTTLKSR